MVEGALLVDHIQISIASKSLLMDLQVISTQSLMAENALMPVFESERYSKTTHADLSSRSTGY
jgi:hypothetical protein